MDERLAQELEKARKHGEEAYKRGDLYQNKYWQGFRDAIQFAAAESSREAVAPQLKELCELLQEIADGRGPFKVDNHEFAVSVIETAKANARRALDIVDLLAGRKEPAITASLRDQVIEEIAQFAETHYCIIDANSLGGYKVCERTKHPNEPFARAIRGMMRTSGLAAPSQSVEKAATAIGPDGSGSATGANNEISITIRGTEQVAVVMKALRDAGFVAAATAGKGKE